MTFLFDPQKGMDALNALEKQWGGTAQERLEKKYASYAREAGEEILPQPKRDEEIFASVDAEARAVAQQTIADTADAAIIRSQNVDSGPTGGR